MSEWEVAEAELESRLRRFGIPVALVVAVLLVKTGIGHFLFGGEWQPLEGRFGILPMIHPPGSLQAIDFPGVGHELPHAAGSCPG